ncbi:MAG TPA: hypothetical protein VLM40_03390, partial [Gemmata sp.]|nr:hypothetical protein [Gemmata sp.]
MADPTATPVSRASRLWNTAAGLPGRNRRAILAALILALIAVMSVAVGLIYWLSAPRVPALLPITITSNPDGSAAGWLEQDRIELSDNQ